MADVKPWPEGLLEEHAEVVRLFEETFAKTTQTPEELRARARELRAEADTTEVLGYREVAIALADRYEQAAASRVASR